ncbi:valine N-monooxygenase 1-like protein, partial [Tanacetum coccineum]
MQTRFQETVLSRRQAEYERMRAEREERLSQVLQAQRDEREIKRKMLYYLRTEEERLNKLREEEAHKREGKSYSKFISIYYLASRNNIIHILLKCNKQNRGAEIPSESQMSPSQEAKENDQICSNTLDMVKNFTDTDIAHETKFKLKEDKEEEEKLGCGHELPRICSFLQIVYSISTLPSLYELTKKCMSHPYGVAMIELINKPRIFKKSVQELDFVVGKDRLVQEDDIPKLNYIKASVREDFRLHLVAPFNIPRVSSIDTTVARYFIPKGSHVLLSRPGLGQNLRCLHGFTWELPSKELHVVLKENLKDLSKVKPILQLERTKSYSTMTNSSMKNLVHLAGRLAPSYVLCRTTGAPLCTLSDISAHSTLHFSASFPLLCAETKLRNNLALPLSQLYRGPRDVGE